MKKALGIVLALTIAFAMAACGAKEDSVRAVSASDGYKCETCKKKTAATYCVTKDGVDHYLAQIADGITSRIYEETIKWLYSC